MMTENIDLIAISAYEWEYSIHFLFDDLNKEILDSLYDEACKNAKTKIQSGIRTQPDDEEIQKEMMLLLKEKGYKPLKIMNYDIRDKSIDETYEL